MSCFSDLYLLLFPGRHSICCFPHCSHLFLTRREPGVPLSLFRSYPLPFSPPFLLVLFLAIPFLLCLFHWSISAVVSGEAFYLLFSPLLAICFWPAGNLECPCLFSDHILFPFLLLFFYSVPYSSFSSMSFSLIYICCSFRGGILSADYLLCPPPL